MRQQAAEGSADSWTTHRWWIVPCGFVVGSRQVLLAYCIAPSVTPAPTYILYTVGLRVHSVTKKRRRSSITCLLFTSSTNDLYPSYKRTAETNNTIIGFFVWLEIQLLVAFHSLCVSITDL